MGAEPAVLGIDVGQSGVRAEVISLSGAVLGSGAKAVPVTAAGGRAEQDVQVWLSAVPTAARRALTAAGRSELAGICVGALGPAPVLLDGDLRPLTPAILYRLDARSEQWRLRLESLTGHTIGADHAVPRLLWWRENHPGLWQRTRAVVDVTGLIVRELTGIAVLDSVTHREYYALDDGEDDQDLRLAGRCEPGAVAGPLCPEAAHALGVVAGAPVLAGSIDSFLDLYAAGVRGPGDGGIVAGSTAVVAMATGIDVLPAARAAGLATSAHLGTGWLVLDWTGAAGSALDWAAGVLSGRRELDHLAARMPPGAGGLVALAGLAPRRDGTGLGVIARLSLATTGAELYRAIVDAVAVDLGMIARRCAAVVSEPHVWHAWGGAFQSAALAQAVADCLGTALAFPGNAVRVAAAEVARQVLLGGSPAGQVRVVAPDPDRAAAMRELGDRAAALAGCLVRLDWPAPVASSEGG
jgi:xylulokinase